MRELEPDQVVDGRYQILDHVGTGGMAEVYCAQDLQLGRRVALKILHRRFAEDEASRRACSTSTSSRSTTAASGTARRTSPWSTSTGAR